jgi:hypothetical protein
MSARIWRAALPLVAAACGIGSPLVDDESSLDGVGAIHCNYPPACGPLSWPTPGLPAAQPLELESCADEARCAPAAASSDEQSSSPGVSCGDELLQALPLVATCSRATVRVPAGVSELDYDGSSWSRLVLRVEAEAPLQITLRHPELRAVDLQLKGPVHLQLEDAQLEDVRIAGESAARGGPQLTFVRLAAQQLRIGAAERSFDGALSMRGCELSELALYVREITTESVKLGVGIVHAQSLSASDTSFANIDVQAEHSLLTAFETERCQLRLCNYASLISGRLNASHITGCEGSVVRMYSSIVTSGALDGEFESDDSDFENSILGATASTQIQAFQSRFSSDALCDSLGLLALDPASSIKCSGCDPGFEHGTAACELPAPPDAASPVHANYCASLRLREHLPHCDPDLPLRMRKR